MKIFFAELFSVSAYSQSRHYDVPKLEKEIAKDYEARTWRERLHVTEGGFVFIPPIAFKNCLAEAAKFLGIQIPGKGKSTYTKHFEAGVLVVDAANRFDPYLLVRQARRRGLAPADALARVRVARARISAPSMLEIAKPASCSAAGIFPESPSFRTVRL